MDAQTQTIMELFAQLTHDEQVAFLKMWRERSAD